jgi:hypothetical protein
MAGVGRLVILVSFLLLGAPVSAQAVWVTGNPDDAKAEPAEAGEKKYWELEGFKEVFVDDDNALYGNRPYQGIIPRVRDELEVLRVPEGQPNTILWVGYQHRRLFSRVFVQTSHMPVFTVLQKTATHIVIVFENTVFHDRNTQREIVTGDFNTRVSRVLPEIRGKGAEVHVRLKQPGSFLYRQEGHYLYLDVERAEP